MKEYCLNILKLFLFYFLSCIVFELWAKMGKNIIPSTNLKSEKSEIIQDCVLYENYNNFRGKKQIICPILDDNKAIMYTYLDKVT